ncbi:hypothetical protein SLE2022_293120 [Rubroshorea leprosula]
MDRSLSKESSLQKKALQNRRKTNHQHVLDPIDFINDMFFETVNGDNKKAYDLTRIMRNLMDVDEQDFDSSTRSNSNRLT